MRTVIDKYIGYSNAKNIEGVLSCFKPNARVIDEEITVNDLDEIEGWLKQIFDAFSPVLNIEEYSEVSEKTVDVVMSVSGSFSSTPVQFKYIFEIQNDLIKKMTVIHLK